MSKKTIVAFGLLSAGVLMASVALAATWSSPKTIAKLETRADTPYSVFISGSVPNPGGCANTDLIEPHANINTAFDKDRVSATLLAAYLAGRQVAFLQPTGSTACSAAGRPTYTHVRIE